MRHSALLLTAALLASGPSFGQGVDRSASPAGGFEKSDVVPDTTEPWRYYPLAVGNKWEFVFDYFTFYGRFIERVTNEVSINGTTYFEITRNMLFGRDEIVQGNPPDYVRFDTLTSLVMVWRDAGQFEEPGNRFWPHWGNDACPLDGHFGGTCPGTNIWIEGGYDRPFVFGGPWPGTGPDVVHTAIKEFWNAPGGADQNNAFFAADIGFIYSDGKDHNEYLYYASIDGHEYGASQFTITNEPLPAGASNRIVVYPNPSTGLVNVVLPRHPGQLLTYRVYDLPGREVAHGTIDTGGTPTSATIDLSALSPGAYIVRISDPFLTSRLITIVR